MKEEDAQRTQSVEGLFLQALDLPPEDRTAFLDQAIPTDSEVRSEIDSLLAAHGRAGRFLKSAAVERGSIDLSAAADSKDTNLGSEIGPYRILRRIGAGGMGAVYLAERTGTEFQKQVAIKLIKPGMDTEEILHRFENERRVLANLEHPNIARLIDGGATEDGRPYLIMEYVDGAPIDQYCDAQQLSTRERIALFGMVCSAVQSAHDQRVVHRDLKPGNIFVGDGGPKLLDFGIAKVLLPDGVERTVDRTAADQRFLSLKYASPEQVRGQTITPASDIYSLGVLLYELLSGRSPYPETNQGPETLAEHVVSHTPERPSRSGTGSNRSSWRTTSWRSRNPFDRELDLVVLKAMRKEPERRYASAAELTEDLGRCLAGRPILARPDSIWYRFEKFVSRNRVSVVAGVLVFAALIFSSIIHTGLLVLAAVAATALYFQSLRAKQSAQEATIEAERQRGAADEVNRFLQDMLEKINPEFALGRDVTLLREILDAAAARVDRELGGRPEIAANLHLTIGNTYRNIAHYDEARAHCEIALRLRRQILPASDPRITAALIRVAQTALDSGSLQEARSRFEEALSRRETEFGTESPEYARLLNDLGLAYQATGEFSESENCLRRALETRRETLGGDHIDVAGSLNDLGQLLDITDRSEEAESFLREAMEVRRAHRSTLPLHFANSLHNLAGCLRDLHRFEEAEALFLEAIDLKRSILEPDHPQLTVTLTNYASQLVLQKRYREAEALHIESLEAQRRVLGNDHVDVGTAINNLGTLLQNTDRFKEAEAAFGEAVDVYVRALGPDHAFVAVALGNLATTHERLSQWESCQDFTESYLEVAQKNWPEDHWRVAHGRSVLGAVRTARGDYRESESLQLEAVRILRAQKGDLDPYTQSAIGRAAALYVAWDRPEDAAEYASMLTPSEAPSKETP